MAGWRIGSDDRNPFVRSGIRQRILQRKPYGAHGIFFILSNLRPMSQYSVLIVDDHELVRRGLRDILRGTEFEVCGEAQNGQEGLAQTVSLRPTLVLLDMSMPVLTGLQAAAKIRKALPDTKILIITMHDSPQMEIEARAAGADAYITKMAAAGSLVDAMRALVAASSA